MEVGIFSFTVMQIVKWDKALHDMEDLATYLDYVPYSG